MTKPDAHVEALLRKAAFEATEHKYDLAPDDVERVGVVIYEALLFSSGQPLISKARAQEVAKAAIAAMKIQDDVVGQIAEFVVKKAHALGPDVWLWSRGLADEIRSRAWKAMKPDRVICPNIEDHTCQPEGYMQWHDWAEKMSKTHKQRKCLGCGKYEIWEPKP